MIRFEYEWDRFDMSQVDLMPVDFGMGYGVKKELWGSVFRHMWHLGNEEVETVTRILDRMSGQVGAHVGLRFGPEIFIWPEGDRAKMKAIYKYDNNGNSVQILISDIDWNERVEREHGACGKVWPYRVQTLKKGYADWCPKCDKWMKWEAKPKTREGASAFIMPFGKHKGTSLTELPESYLKWGVEALDNKNIKSWFKYELECRSWM